MNKIDDPLPLLPEWAEQGSAIITWPHTGSYWDPALKKAEICYVEMSRAITMHENLMIICENASHQQHIEKLFAQNNLSLNRVRFYAILTNDVWIRDYGPLTLGNLNQKKLLNFRFDSWGKKYAWQLDDKVTQVLYEANAFADNILFENIDFILEGGSIETDGEGTLLTTKSCLIEAKRNNLTPTEIEQRLKKYFNIKTILWLEDNVLVGDDTNGHIDTLARFVNPTTICYVKCDDPNDEHFESLNKMEQQLKTFQASSGDPYRLIPLPLPHAIYSKIDAQRLPATYANFLIINKAVLLPIYNDPHDKIALLQLQKCFPRRIIIPIDTNALIENFGSIHCATMQLPKGALT